MRKIIQACFFDGQTTGPIEVQRLLIAIHFRTSRPICRMCPSQYRRLDGLRRLASCSHGAEVGREGLALYNCRQYKHYVDS